MANSPYEIMEIDPSIKPYKADIDLRMQRYNSMKQRLLGTTSQRITDFANGHLYFGFHCDKSGWYYREWAPNAEAISLFGDFNNWNSSSHKLNPIGNGVWEIFIAGRNTLVHGSKVKIQITADGHSFDRIPLYCKRVIQDPATKTFDGLIWNPPHKFKWTDESFNINHSIPPLIYESHIGMASDEARIATFTEFTKNILPRIHKLGYNTIQLMAIMEHPYYGSFGYQVSNFFAVSSRFGTPEELKKLINTAHKKGIAVLLDIVHSHAARNEVEGIGAFDGTDYQFFHAGQRGEHPVWGTKLFNYGKPEVIHFLLSNLKFWLDEYHFDGFRFDGITSMLYHDHGLGGVFDNYKKFFSLNTDIDAITYLQLATTLIKEIKPASILVAEDMSGMPGMCLPILAGGIGFDYRLNMGIPDFWIRTLRNKKDEDWDMEELWYELSQHRPQEKVINYAESHDQALVGDKTIFFWLADKETYWNMDIDSKNIIIDRAIALHKLIRLISITIAGDGYLNFMGNEFGHPEWIDFPREGNGWSYHYACRRWHLADDKKLRFQFLQQFDKTLIQLFNERQLLNYPTELIYTDNEHKIIVCRKQNLLFIFNFHPSNDHVVTISSSASAKFHRLLLTNIKKFGEYSPDTKNVFYQTSLRNNQYLLEVPLQKRSAAILEPVK